MSITPLALLIGLTEQPTSSAVPLAHACQRGSHRALCGAATSVFVGTWPVDVSAWPASLARCPQCARQAEAPFGLADDTP